MSVASPSKSLPSGMTSGRNFGVTLSIVSGQNGQKPFFAGLLRFSQSNGGMPGRLKWQTREVLWVIGSTLISLGTSLCAKFLRGSRNLEWDLNEENSMGILQIWSVGSKGGT